MQIWFIQNEELKSPFVSNFLKNKSDTDRFRSSSGFYILIVLKELGLGRSNFRLIQKQTLTQ